MNIFSIIGIVLFSLFVLLFAYCLMEAASEKNDWKGDE